MRHRLLVGALTAVASCARQPAGGGERARPNDNRVAAGTLHDGVLTLHLEARRGFWYPDENDGPGLMMEMFAEAGHPPQNPGPLIRVTADTRIDVTVRNALRDSTLVVYGLHTRPSAIDVDRSGIDSQLHGAFVVDPEGGAPAADRVFVLGSWTGPPDREGINPELRVINGLSWPHTEKFTYDVGDTVRWRWVNPATGHTQCTYTDSISILRIAGAGRPILSSAPATRAESSQRCRCPAAHTR